MATTNDDIMTAMIDQETESGVDFSFDILKYVNGEEEGCMLWNDNDNIKYTQQETVLDPALITGIVLSPTPTTSTSNPNPFIILKDSSSDVPVSTTTSTSNGKQFEETSTSIFFQETHNPWGEPSAKMPTSTRNVRLRANTKLDMDRQKAQEEERRDKELQKTQRAPSQSTAVPVSLPSVNVVVPPRVLQVHSALENPTPFHVEQKRRLNIQQYIANSLPDAHASSLGASVAPLRHPVKHNRIQHIVADGAVSSAPPNYSTTPLSPVSALEPGAAPSPGPSQRSSVATSVNDEYEESILMELQELLMNDEKSGDQFNKSDQVASLPQPGFNRVSGVPEASSSCPADSTKDANGDPVKVTKDRIKKDNHNKIERKRRFHINDMITEQGRLLPKQNERHHEIIGDVKQNKGSILKASVDYTKALKHDNENLFHKLQNIELENKALLLKLKHLEQFCKQSGLQLPENIITWKSCSSPEELNALLSNDVVKIKQEPITYPVDDICDIMDEDRSIVTGSSDPMFGQPAEADDGFHHPEGMDFND